MTKQQLAKMKKLSKFLHDNKMSLSGKEVFVDFRGDKHNVDKECWLNLGLGLINDSYEYVKELPERPKVEEYYVFDEKGRLKRTPW